MPQQFRSVNVEMMNRLLDTSVADSSMEVFSPTSAADGAEAGERAPASPARVLPSLTEHGTPAIPSVFSTPRHLRVASNNVLFNGFDNEWELDVCAICLSQVESLEEAGRLPCPCVAVYHRDCIARWLLKNNSCPQCRVSAEVADQMNYSDPTCPKHLVQAEFANAKLGSHSMKSCAEFDFEDVVMMYHCSPPYQQAADSLYALNASAQRDALDGDRTEVWASVLGPNSAVIAVSQPATSSEGAAQLHRGILALQCVWMYAQGPTFITMFHPECLLQSPEYTACTGVVWRILDAEEPQIEPPCIIQWLFILFVKIQLEARNLSRWFKCMPSSRALVYLAIIALVMITFFLGLHEVCYVETSGRRVCAWGYDDALMRRAIFYTSY